MGNFFSPRRGRREERQAAPPPPPEPRELVKPRDVVREGAERATKKRTRRRAGYGGGGASMSGTILTGAQGVDAGAGAARKALLGD